MISTDFHDPELPQDEMAALTTQMRAVTRRLSRDQILDLADVLHEIIRERQLEVRSWRRLHDRIDAQPDREALDAPAERFAAGEAPGLPVRSPLLRSAASRP